MTATIEETSRKIQIAPDGYDIYVASPTIRSVSDARMVFWSVVSERITESVRKELVALPWPDADYESDRNPASTRRIPVMVPDKDVPEWNHEREVCPIGWALTAMGDIEWLPSCWQEIMDAFDRLGIAVDTDVSNEAVDDAVAIFIALFDGGRMTTEEMAEWFGVKEVAPVSA
jgi:hypothetical protein